nr:transposase [Actinopolyspora mortivallis]
MGDHSTVAAGTWGPSARGGRRRAGDRAVLTAIVFVLTSGCSWRQLPPSFWVSVLTAHRRFQEWIQVGVWRRLYRAMLDEIGADGELDGPE